jgi:hypothetical protein
MNSTSSQPLNAPPWADWLLRGPGILLCFLWGFAEGTLFFILPDVPLSLAALYWPRRALLHLAAIVSGAVLAGAVMFSWSAHSTNARLAVAQVPLVRAAMFERADSDYRQFGVWAVALGPERGIPYKIYAIEAPLHTSLTAFLLVTIPARTWRLLAIWMGFALAGLLLRKSRRTAWAPALHAFFWVAVYLVYWVKVK